MKNGFRLSGRVQVLVVAGGRLGWMMLIGPFAVLSSFTAAIRATSSRSAGPIGRYLAARGRFFMPVDANGPLPGMVGKYLAGKMPKYFRGPDRPRLGDL